MANLLSIAELAWRQFIPNPGAQNAITKEEFQATAKTEYAYQMWLKSKLDKREEGMFLVPSYLLSEAEMEVVDNEIDLSDLKIMKGLDENDLWLQNVGGISCECKYVKSSLNMTQLMCDDDSLGENVRTFFVMGKKVKFPSGTHKDKLTIIYANNGENVDGGIEVDDAIAGIVRTRLNDIYGGNKTGQEDKSNDNNSNTK